MMGEASLNRIGLDWHTLFHVDKFVKKKYT